jgi:hypothetical protein
VMRGIQVVLRAFPAMTHRHVSPRSAFPGTCSASVFVMSIWVSSRNKSLLVSSDNIWVMTVEDFLKLHLHFSCKSGLHHLDFSLPHKSVISFSPWSSSSLSLFHFSF